MTGATASSTTSVVLLVLANLIWAAQPTAVKYIPGTVLGPFAIAFLPLFVITPLLMPLLSWRRPGEPVAARPTAGDWLQFAIAGVGGQLVAQLGMTWGSVVGQASSCAILLVSGTMSAGLAVSRSFFQPTSFLASDSSSGIGGFQLSLPGRFPRCHCARIECSCPRSPALPIVCTALS